MHTKYDHFNASNFSSGIQKGTVNRSK